jgi:chitinase
MLGGVASLVLGLVLFPAAPIPAAAAATRYEAESATISQGVVESNHAGFSGTGFVNYNNVVGSYVEWTVNAASAGTATLAFRFANGSTSNRPMDITVNGSLASDELAFNPTGAWTTWQTVTVTAAVNAGTNTIRATATTASGGPNLDYLDVEAAAPATDYQAENATIVQGVVESNWSGFTGTGFVNYNNVVGSYVQWTVSAPSAGSTSLAFRFANGSTANRPMDITVNGTLVRDELAFNPTGAWTAWHTVTITAALGAGNNTIRATATTANGGPNVDRLTAGGGTQPPSRMAAAPYEYLGWGSPQPPTDVMAATGVTWFTLAFILSDGTCNPAWDGSRPLTGGSDQAAINSIRAAGGDVVVSAGGWEGRKLGEYCSSATALAGAYQKVINAYGLKAFDVDIENTEFSNNTVQQRVIDALKIVKANNPGITTYITFGTTPTGPDSTGRALIGKGAASGLNNDGWVIMPFDFGSHSGTMGEASISAAEGLKGAVKSAYGYTDAVTYSKIGISSMNGRTDVGETVTTSDFQLMLGYARQHHIARFTFWSINRDRPCTAGSTADSCSGITQQPYDFAKIIVQYTG